MSGRLKSPPSRKMLFLFFSRRFFISATAVSICSRSCLFGGLLEQLSDIDFLGPILMFPEISSVLSLHIPGI